MDPRNVVVSTAMRMAPDSAVPMDAPRLVTVFCTPPTSPLWESGTAETVTLPSCEASVPIPSPARRSGPVTMSAPGSGVQRRQQHDDAEEQRPKPTRTIRRGDVRGKSLGTPTALASSVTESGSKRTPVATAESPRATDKKRGITKKRPDCSMNWKKNDVSPPCSRGTLSI